MDKPLLAQTGVPGWWNRYWFRESTCVRLAVMRLIAVGVVLIPMSVYWKIGIEPTFRVPLDYTLALAQAPTGFEKPQPLATLCATILGEENFRSVKLLTTLHHATTVTAVFAFIGLFTRPMLALHAILSGILVAHSFSYGEKHHPEAIYILFLFMLALAPCNRAYSVDAWLAKLRLKGDPAEHGWGPRARFTTALWPILTVQVLLCMAYFMAGLCKLKLGGLDWFNGDTLQGYIFEDVIHYEERFPDRELTFGQWVCRQRWLCVLASYATVIYELLFPIILIFPRLAPLFLLGGVVMHVGIDLSLSAAFYQYLTLYLSWVPWDRWFGNRSGGASESTPSVDA